MATSAEATGGDNPVIRNCAQYLVHVPDLMPYSSKPHREIAKDPAVGPRLAVALRSFPEALA